LNNSAYIPCYHQHIIIPYPLLCPFPIYSTYPRLVVRFLNNIFYGMRLSAKRFQSVSLSVDSTF
jgi:hypothetical protein